MKEHFAVALVEVRARVVSDSAGGTVEIPALLSADGILIVLADYFMDNLSRSLQWMKLARRAVKLFIMYVSVNPFESEPHKIFLNFAARLVKGTVDRDTGIDASALYWQPISARQAGNVVTALTLFFDWMQMKDQLRVHPNPVVEGAPMERTIAEAAYQHKRSAAFLGHGWASNLSASYQSSSGVRLASVRVANSLYDSHPKFPDNRFEEFLFEGFRVKGRHNYRDMLITLLMRGAGFRVSEPFHLFVSDVSTKSGVPARVFIHHPEQGGVPVEPNPLSRSSDRAAYLASRWQLLPRNRISGTKHAGWKGGLHTTVERARVFPAFWFPESCGVLFSEIWPYYMRQVAVVERMHPFAFINIYSGSNAGEMLSMKTFRNSHDEAVRRIGLEVSKSAGTTAHGHRHAYGQSLSDAHVDEKTIQTCMHHADIQSQQVYTQPDLIKVATELRSAQGRLPTLLQPHMGLWSAS